MEKPANDDKKDIVKLAHMFFHNGQWDQALLEYKKILAIDPGDLNTYNTLGDIYLKKNSIELAYGSYSKAASGFLNRGQTGKALQAYKKITKLDTFKLSEDVRRQIKIFRGYVNIGEALKEERIEAAIETLAEILRLRAEDPVAPALLLELDEKIAQMPVSIHAYQALGDAFLKYDMLEKAKQMFAKIKAIDPRDPAVRLHMAQVYVRQGSENEAKNEYLNLASQALTENNLDQSLEFAQKAVELKSVEAHHISGLIYFKQGKFEKAAIEFEKFLRFKVNHLGALLHLGRSFDQLGLLEKAEGTFNKALTVDKDDPQVQEAWIDFCVRHKDRETVIPNLTVLIDKTVTSDNAERIAKFSRMMIKFDPNLIFPHFKLIESLQASGDLYGTADTYCSLALIYEKQNQLNEATQCLEKALVLNPSNSEVLEKALAWMKQKKLQVIPFPAPKLDTADPLPREGSGPVEVARAGAAGAHTHQGTVDSRPTLPKTVSLNTFDSQMAMADTCAQQGLLKAAIEIYQHLLEANPDSMNIQKKLIEVSDSYIKQLTKSK